MGSIASQYNTSIIGTLFQDITGFVANSFHSAKDHFLAVRAERELRLLDDRMLADIGLNRGEITHAVRYGKDI